MELGLPETENGRGVKRPFDESIGVDAVDQITSTELGHPETYSFVWQIKNFSGIGPDEVKSPVLISPVATPHKWQVKVRVTKDDKVPCGEVLGVYISLLGFGDGWIPGWFLGRKLRAVFQICLIDGQDKLQNPIGDLTRARNFGRCTTWGKRDYIAMDDLMTPGFLTNDTVRFHCVIRWFKREIRYFTHKSLAERDHEVMVHDTGKRCRLEVANDIANLQCDESSCDVDIKTQTGTLKAHRSVLISRSPIFAQLMAEHPIGEFIEVDLSVFSESTVKTMLDFIYQGKVDRTQLAENGVQICGIAERVKLIPLKEAAERELALGITENNAADRLFMAADLKAKTLLPEVVNFIQHHPAVKATESYKYWKEQKPNLYLRLQLDFPNVFSDEA